MTKLKDELILISTLSSQLMGTIRSILIKSRNLQVMLYLKSLRTFIASLLFVVAVSPVQAQAQADSASVNPLEGIPSGAYEVDVTHASVIWKVSHFGFSTYVGRFNNFSADLSLDSKDFTKSRVDVDIKVDSIDTDYPLADEKDFNAILAEDWFKSDEYPSITFKATSVSPLEGNKATITGDMTMLGETHPVVLDMTLNKASPSHPFKRVPIIGFSAKTKLDRTVWGLVKHAPRIGAEVVIEIEGEFLKTK